MEAKEWIAKAASQYTLHGVSEEKAKMWAESLLVNQKDAIKKCPYVSAEICYRS
jgi:hypothetical protein